MLFEGSCGCGAVGFQVRSNAPYPYLRGFGRLDRKIAGSGGFAAFLFAHAPTLEIDGKEHIRIFHWPAEDGGEPILEHHFCGQCGSALWQFDPRWPDHLHPYATAVDSPLPVPPEYNDFNIAERASWVNLPPGDNATREDGGYTTGMAAWHREKGWLVED